MENTNRTKYISATNTGDSKSPPHATDNYEPFSILILRQQRFGNCDLPQFVQHAGQDSVTWENLLILHITLCMYFQNFAQKFIILPYFQNFAQKFKMLPNFQNFAEKFKMYSHLLSLLLPLRVPRLLALMLVGDLEGTRLALKTRHQTKMILTILVWFG